jgi:2-methylisocitrate lyase-like PEP mutase family enzyme
LDNAAEIVQATDLPVSADLEDGFGAAPDTCAETIRLACQVGLVGGSIEDATGDFASPIYDLSHAAERVQAAAEAARSLPFLLTARAENYLWDRFDLDDTIRRLQAFSAAGADVLYAPGLPDIEAIRTVCAAVDKPVNVVMGLRGPNYSVAELSAAGVRRVSVGGSFARAALGALLRAAEEVKSAGTFGYAADAVSAAVMGQLMSQEKCPDRQ